MTPTQKKSADFKLIGIIALDVNETKKTKNIFSLNLLIVILQYND